MKISSSLHVSPAKENQRFNFSPGVSKSGAKSRKLSKGISSSNNHLAMRRPQLQKSRFVNSNAMIGKSLANISNKHKIPKLKSRFLFPGKGKKGRRRYNRGGLDEELSDSSSELKKRKKKPVPKSPDLKLLYMPTKEIKASEDNINHFRSFDSLQGSSAFLK